MGKTAKQDASKNRAKSAEEAAKSLIKLDKAMEKARKDKSK